MDNGELYPETESFTVPISPNVSVVVSNSRATPNPVTLSKKLQQQAVWTSATTAALVTLIEIDFAGKPQPFAGTVVGTKLTLQASSSGVCASGPIATGVNPPPAVYYTYRIKIGNNWGPSAGIRIDP
jgi:hypothetical protein